jgi:hypothetical protein
VAVTKLSFEDRLIRELRRMDDGDRPVSADRLAEATGISPQKVRVEMRRFMGKCGILSWNGKGGGYSFAVRRVRDSDIEEIVRVIQQYGPISARGISEKTGLMESFIRGSIAGDPRVKLVRGSGYCETPRRYFSVVEFFNANPGESYTEGWIAECVGLSILQVRRKLEECKVAKREGRRWRRE